MNFHTKSFDWLFPLYYNILSPIALVNFNKFSFLLEKYFLVQKYFHTIFTKRGDWWLQHFLSLKTNPPVWFLSVLKSDWFKKFRDSLRNILFVPFSTSLSTIANSNSHKFAHFNFMPNSKTLNKKKETCVDATHQDFAS